MPNLTVQRFIYRNLAQRPAVSRALDAFGGALNKIGLPYATGLTRNKSILFASINQPEINKAREALLAAERTRALRAAIFHVPGETNLLDILRKDGASAPQKILRSALDAKLTFDQIAYFFGKIEGVGYRNENDRSVFFSLSAVLNKAKDILSPGQIVDLFGKITDSGDISHVLFVLPAALDKAKDILSPDQIICLFSKILKKCGVHSGYVFEPLPEALDKAKDILSPDQIISLFSKIADKRRDDARESFVALSAALDKAKEILSPDQFFDLFNLFNKIVEKCNADRAFETLPESLNKVKEVITSQQISDFFGKIVEICGENSGYAFKCLPAALEAKLTQQQVIGLFTKIVEKVKGAAKEAFKAFVSLFEVLSFKDALAVNAALSRFTSMIDGLTDHNRERILNLLSENKGLYQQIGTENFLPHYNLYVDILTNRKRMGYPLLEGILEATRQGIIPKVITQEEVRKINHFINQTNSFSPIVYKVYKAKGESVLQELKPLAEKVLKDNFGKEEIDAIIKKYEKYDGLEFLYAIIQMSIPLSGASFVKREEGKGLLKKMMEAGDIRSHVPAALKDKVKSVSLEGGEYALREGEEINPRVINPILEGLRSEKKADLPELVSVVEAYLMSDRSEVQKEKVREVLYHFVSRQDLLGEKVDRLGGADYYTLRLLEEIFKDKDCLSSILARAVEGINQNLLATLKTSLTHAEGLIKAIRKMWQGSGSHDEKVNRLAGMTTKYSEADFRDKVISKLNRETDREIINILEEVLKQEKQAYVSKRKLAEDILREPLAAIQKEKAKYELKIKEGEIKLSLQVVKGIPYSLWGLNAGVCIASDIELWKDPNFKLIAMINEETKTAVGFIHVYEVKIKGKKYWALPGIEPSTEFIGTVNPEELYDKVIQEAIETAQEAGINGVYIPTSPIIHSNRSGIQKIIKSKNYSTESIPQVNWSRSPAYPFNEVYLVWKKKSD